MRDITTRLGSLAAAGVLSLCGGAACGQGSSGGPIALPELTAVPMEPTPTATASIEDTPSSSEPASDGATPTPTITRDPDDGDRGAFIRTFAPAAAVDLDLVANDLDGDGIREVVATYVADGQVQLDVAWWTGSAYRVDTQLDGGAARRIDRMQVRDINADGATEVVVEFTGDGSFGGVSLWTVTGNRQVSGLIAVGGCHSGRSTYGAIGATLSDRDGDGASEIMATCDDAPLTQADWTTDTYVWSDGAYRLQSSTSAPTPAPDPDEGDLLDGDTGGGGDGDGDTNG